MGDLSKGLFCALGLSPAGERVNISLGLSEGGLSPESEGVGQGRSRHTLPGPALTSPGGRQPGTASKSSHQGGCSEMSLNSLSYFRLC